MLIGNTVNRRLDFLHTLRDLPTTNDGHNEEAGTYYLPGEYCDCMGCNPRCMYCLKLVWFYLLTV
jgi:hypothetical protein